jgi:carbamate kinase
VQAVTDFVEATDGRGVITEPQNLPAVLVGDAGTFFVLK